MGTRGSPPGGTVHVVGAAHGKDAKGPGRTVRSLIRAAPCPVLVVNRSVVGPYARVTVPVDFSDAAARALRSVASLGLVKRAHVRVVHAFGVLGKPRLSGFGIPREQIDGYVESWRSVYAQETNAFLEAQELAGRNWATRVEDGRPDEVIGSLAARTSSELLVMGTRARTGFRRALLGSVTEAVLAAGQADVLVVPPPRPGSSDRSDRGTSTGRRRPTSSASCAGRTRSWFGLFEALAQAGGPPFQVPIDPAAVKAHRYAAGGNGGAEPGHWPPRPEPAEGRGAGAQPRSTPSQTASAARSLSC